MESSLYFGGEPRTPENWPEIYSQYLEDSPSSRHSGTTLHQSPVRISEKELETDRKLETMRRHADNFFNRTLIDLHRQRLKWPDVKE